MQKKIYVAGMDDDASAAKVSEEIKKIAGVTSVVATPAKCQICVDFDDESQEAAINGAIEASGIVVLG